MRLDYLQQQDFLASSSWRSFFAGFFAAFFTVFFATVAPPSIKIYLEPLSGNQSQRTGCEGTSLHITARTESDAGAKPRLAGGLAAATFSTT